MSKPEDYIHIKAWETVKGVYGMTPSEVRKEQEIAAHYGAPTTAIYWSHMLTCWVTPNKRLGKMRNKLAEELRRERRKRVLD